MRWQTLRIAVILGSALSIGWGTWALGCDARGSKASFVDGDKDGLSDKDETALAGTSPILADTDGDGMSDYDESVLHGFDPSVASLPFNPRVADMPLLNVRILGPPSVSLRLTTTTGETWTYTTTQAVDQTVSVTASVTETDSFSSTGSVSDTVNEQKSVTFNGTSLQITERDAGQVDAGDRKPPPIFDPGGPEVVTLTAGAASTITWSNTTGVTLSFTAGQTRSLSQAFSWAQSYARSHQLIVSGGILQVLVEVENRGNLPFRITNLLLAATLIGPDGTPIPIGNLDINTQNFTFVPYSIAPGGKQGPVNFVRDTLTLEQVAALLEHPDALNITVGSYELVDSDNRPYVFDALAIRSRTATVVIDYGDLRRRERYLVATNLRPGSPGVSMRQALGEILQIPYVDDPEHGLLSMSEVDAGDVGQWTVEQRRNRGRVEETTVYEPPYDFSGIVLRAGDVIILRLLPP